LTVRPKLNSLADRMATKPMAKPPEPLQPVAHKEPEGREDGRVQILVRMEPAARKALRRLALEQDTTVQALVEEAIRDLLHRHGGGGH
jgi:hypothetical protein